MTDEQLISCEVHRMRQRLYLAGIPREDAAQAARLALLKADTPYRTTVIRRAIIDEIDRWSGCWRKGLGGTKQHLSLDPDIDVPDPIGITAAESAIDAQWRRAWAMRQVWRLPRREGQAARSVLAGESTDALAKRLGIALSTAGTYQRDATRLLRRVWMEERAS